MMRDHKESHKKSGHKFLRDARNGSSNFQTSLFNLRLQRPSLLPFSFSAFPPLPPRVHPHVSYPCLSTIEVKFFEGKEEVENKWNG